MESWNFRRILTYGPMRTEAYRIKEVAAVRFESYGETVTKKGIQLWWIPFALFSL